ncbi:hypothetical protein C0Q70_06837 [Pomacea canaliculata]|uniref:Mannosyltransferase n=1 Tax=Pomacea canaliculata TaxID=400727 RepID=A0A2T7PDD2_POMCA|nr:hypothetical protein C0Q70_06837 [Pomacea canaliculata]
MVSAASQHFSRARKEANFSLQQDGGVLSEIKSESSRGCMAEVDETWANRCFPNASNLKSGDSEDTAAPSWTSGVADQVMILMEHTSFILCGLVAALCIYIRVDTALFLAVILLPSYSIKTVNHANLVKCVIGACAGTALGLIVDFRFYGDIVVTPINWAKFNIFDDFSSKYFSSSSFFKYFDELFVRDKGQSMLGIVSVAGLAILICGNRKSSGRKAEKESGENSVALVLRLTFSWLFLLLVYSCKGHKEVRFVHNVIVLILVTSASVICQTVAIWRQNGGGNFLKIVWLCLALHAALQWKRFPSARDGSNQSWAYHGTWDSHDINACLAYVGEQTDVTGVFVDRNLHKRNYNYVIITRKRRFVSVGYETVFEQGTMRVMKRTFHPDHERQLLEKAARAPIGVNSTVLQYEGDVLFRFQKFRLAAERYLAALSLDPMHVHTFQGLVACATELGDQAEAGRWTQECIDKFGQLNCRQTTRHHKHKP